jgi:hypothetical protein
MERRSSMSCMDTIMRKVIQYTVKKVSDSPVPSRHVTNKTIPGQNNLIIPGQGEFG